jgi:hypothetical protein
VQVLFPAIKPHVNAVTAAILNEAAMERLMDVANQVSHESQCRALLVAWGIW